MVSPVNRVITLAVILVRPGLLKSVFRIKGNHPAFASGCNNLVLAKREGAGVANGPHRPALISCANRLSAVLDYLQAKLTRQFHDPIHLAWPSRKMHGDNCLGRGSHNSANRLRGYVLAASIHIREYRTRAYGNGAARRGDKRSRRSNHLVAGSNAESSECEFQCQTAVGDSDCMRSTDVSGEFLLKLAAFISGPVIYFAGREHADSRLDLIGRKAGPGEFWA